MYRRAWVNVTIPKYVALCRKIFVNYLLINYFKIRNVFESGIHRFTKNIVQ